MAGPGSQKNKAHKAGRRAGRSAREKHRDKKDMVHRPGIKSSGNTVRGKADRVNAAKQQRDRKRAELLEARRAAGPPTLVALLPLSDDVDVQALWDGLLAACADVSAPSAAGNSAGVDGGMEIDDGKAAGGSGGVPTLLAPITLSLPERRKVKFTFLPPPTDRSDALAVVELGRAAEVLLCVLSGDVRAVAVDDEGSVALGVLRAMGLPSTVALVQSGTDAAGQASLKERSAAKKRAGEAFTAHIPGDHRLLSADAPADFKQILRHLADSPHAAPLWRRQRAQLVAQEASFLPDPSDPGKGRLVLTGYIRGQALGAAQALHVPTAGDFQIEAIEGPPEPAASNEATRLRAGGPAAMEAEGSGLGGAPVLARVDPDAREPLVRENEPDLLDAEQTWPTEAELREAEEERAAAAARRKRLLPKGTSDYQAAWIPDDGEDWNDEASDGDGDDDGSLPDLEPNEGVGPADMEPDNGDEPWNVADGGATEADMDYDVEMEGREDAAAAKARARREAEADDAQFPDEVETPMDVPARRRFARYRGLKSFRTSPWDPKEDLPQDYARVFAFENWKRTMKRAREAAAKLPDPGAGVLAGTWVAVAAAGVPAEAALRVVERVRASQTGAAPVLTAWGLMQHECKLSVLNFGVRKAAGYTDPIANKEDLLFVTGLRSFPARPIFSTDEHGADKHKMERFLMEGRPSVATVFAPIAYPPLPLLAFKVAPSGRAVLAATGALRDCNPDRVVLKKIVLSGYPVKAHKSKAVVRWMFHTPEDVKWFRPVELWTKQGRRGRIREPVGTHGTMKAIFDGPLGQQDAVCMSLYKRAFPKWPQDLTFA